MFTLRRKDPSHSRTAQETPSLNRVSDQKWKLRLKKTLHPRGGSPAAGKSVARIINLSAHDFLGRSGNENETTRFDHTWRRFFKLPERIRRTEDSPKGPYIEVNQDNAVVELEKITAERNTKQRPQCTPAMLAMFSSPLRQINWLQGGTQVQCCDRFPGALQRQLLSAGNVKAFFQQTDETTQVTTRETSVLATHKTVENSWIS